MSRVKKGQGDNEVGYKRPPKQWQFKKGQSGNKGGRPKKSPTSFCEQLGKLLERMLSRNITLTKIDGTVSSVGVTDALVQKVISNALKTGEPRMLELLIKLTDMAEQENDNRSPLKIIVEGGLPK